MTLFILDNRLSDAIVELKALNLKLSVENEQIRSGTISSIGAGGGAAAASKISQLESKLLTQQEQLTELHKRKGENSQMIVDLRLSLDKQEKLLSEKEAKYTSNYIQFVCVFTKCFFFLFQSKQNRIAEQSSKNTSLHAEVDMLTQSLGELKQLNTCLRDEHTALQLAFAALEDKLRKSQVYIKNVLNIDDLESNSRFLFAG